MSGGSWRPHPGHMNAPSRKTNIAAAAASAPRANPRDPRLARRGAPNATPPGSPRMSAGPGSKARGGRQAPSSPGSKSPNRGVARDSVNRVNKLNPFLKNVSVDVIILSVLERREQARGGDWITHFLAADETGCVELTVWREPDALLPGDIVSVRNGICRLFQRRLQLEIAYASQIYRTGAFTLLPNLSQNISSWLWIPRSATNSTLVPIDPASPPSDFKTWNLTPAVRSEVQVAIKKASGGGK